MLKKHENTLIKLSKELNREHKKDRPSIAGAFEFDGNTYLVHGHWLVEIQGKVEIDGLIRVGADEYLLGESFFKLLLPAAKELREITNYSLEEHKEEYNDLEALVKDYNEYNHRPNLDTLVEIGGVYVPYTQLKKLMPLFDKDALFFVVDKGCGILHIINNEFRAIIMGVQKSYVEVNTRLLNKWKRGRV